MRGCRERVGSLKSVQVVNLATMGESHKKKIIKWCLNIKETLWGLEIQEMCGDLKLVVVRNYPPLHF